MANDAELWECPGCGASLDVGALGFFARVTCPACGREDHVHTMLANFRIEGLLGIGGMSVVLRAKDLVLDRPLAIKVLNDTYRDQPERIARFERECELMAKVRHENVVSVYSAGWARGQFYIAMELINGHNLEGVVNRDGPMSPDRVIEVARQVALGLEAAHRAGLLHRDMKPGNILINQSGQAKVLDFGLSLGNRDEDTEETIWATPFYVAPETLTRGQEDLRTDIYALGMTLRHLLTGHENFASKPESTTELLECKRRLPRLASELPHLEPSFCGLVDHMTRFDIAERPVSYASLLGEIDEVRADLEAAGLSNTPAARRRQRRRVAVGAAATIAAGVAACFLTAALSRPEPLKQSITPPAHREWFEFDILEKAPAALEAGDADRALELLRTLAASEGEPAACAWASAYGYLLCLIQGNLFETDDSSWFLERLRVHLARPATSAGQTARAELNSLFNEESETEPTLPEMLAARACLRLRDAHAACKDNETPQLLRDASQALTKAGKPGAALARLLDQLASHLGDSFEARAAQRYERALATLDVDEACRMLDLQQAQASSPQDLRQLTVRKEACELLKEAVALLDRHSLAPAPGTEVTPDTLRTAAAALSEPLLSAEFAALFLVAEGSFEEAGEINPYRDEPESEAPFAIIMRDWLERAL